MKEISSNRCVLIIGSLGFITPEERAELIHRYLEHGEEQEAIARAGQRRTLQEHTYYQRMQELVEIVSKYI